MARGEVGVGNKSYFGVYGRRKVRVRLITALMGWV